MHPAHAAAKVLLNDLSDADLCLLNQFIYRYYGDLSEHAMEDIQLDFMDRIPGLVASLREYPNGNDPSLDVGLPPPPQWRDLSPRDRRLVDILLDQYHEEARSSLRDTQGWCHRVATKFIHRETMQQHRDDLLTYNPGVLEWLRKESEIPGSVFYEDPSGKKQESYQVQTLARRSNSAFLCHE